MDLGPRRGKKLRKNDFPENNKEEHTAERELN